MHIDSNNNNNNINNITNKKRWYLLYINRYTEADSLYNTEKNGVFYHSNVTYSSCQTTNTDNKTMTTSGSVKTRTQVCRCAQMWTVQNEETVRYTHTKKHTHTCTHSCHVQPCPRQKHAQINLCPPPPKCITMLIWLNADNTHSHILNFLRNNTINAAFSLTPAEPAGGYFVTWFHANKLSEQTNNLLTANQVGH